MCFERHFRYRDIKCKLLKSLCVYAGLKLCVFKVLHSRWPLVLQLEYSRLQRKVSGSYFTEDGQWYCSLNEVHYSELCVKDTSQQLETSISVLIKCFTVKIIWKLL